MNIKQAVNGKVIVEVEEQSMSGSFMVPLQYRKPEACGRVIAAPKTWKDAKGREHTVEFSIGQRVIFTMASGMTMEHNGRKWRVLNADEVLAVITTDT